MDSGTSFTGSSGNDTFLAGLSSGGANTLGSLDSLNGGTGTNTLTIELATSVTPSSITNIQNINVSSDAITSLNLLNATGVTSISNAGSTAVVSVTNIGSLADLAQSNTAVGATFAFKAAAVSGADDAVTLTLADVTAGVTTITGAITTLNVVSSGTSNALASLASTSTALNISGASDIDFGTSGAGTIGRSATTISAADATGAVTLVSAHQTLAVSVTGGAGDDTITMTGAVAVSDTVDGGVGDDRIVFTANLANGDVVTGGADTDTIVGTAANLEALTTSNHISGFEVVEVSNALTGTLVAATVQAGASVTLAAGTNADDTGTVTFAAGAQSLLLGGANAGALTVNDTGLAVTDSLTITADDGADQFSTELLAVNGFESVTINTGDTDQTVTTITVTGDVDTDGVATAATLTLSGDGKLSTGIITLGVNDTGHGSIDASGLAGGLVMVGAAVGVISITGGAGDDTIVGEDTHASVLTGNDGDDQITGGAGNDTITAGAGDDTVTGSAGTADSVTGGAGNDTFKYTDAQLQATTVIDGGDGDDILSMQDITAVDDLQFTLVTSVEELTSAATGMNVALGAKALAAGITTITFAGTDAGGIADAVTLAAAFTRNVTVNLDVIDDAAGVDDTNTVTATAYTGVLSVVAENIDDFGYDAGTELTTIIGGTGATDTLTLVGGDYTTGTRLDQVSKIESFIISDDVSTSITLVDGNIADGKALVIDGTAIANAANTFTVVGTAEQDGSLTVLGSAGVDTLTGTASDLGDNLQGNSGADIFNFAAANLTTLDTVTGGAGTDTLKITTDAIIADADFTNVTTIERLEFTAATTATVTLGAQYVESGSAKITLSANTNSLNLDAVTSAQTLVLVAGTDTVDASSMTGDLTVTAASASITSADTLTAGTGNNTLTVTFAGAGLSAANLAGVSGFDTIKSATDAATGAFVLADANLASSAAITLDFSANTTTVATVSAVNETNGAVTIITGGGNDAVIASASSFGDNISTGAGDDTVTFAVAQLTSDDTVDGGAGDDTLTFSDGGILADADFTNVSSFKTLTLFAGTTAVLGAQFQEAGFTVFGTSTGTNSVTIGAGVTANQAVALSSGTDTLSATAYTGALTVTAAEDNLDASDVVTGGTGSDTLTITFDGTGITSAEMVGVTKFETIKTATDATGSLILNDANVASSTVTINATANLTAAFTFDGSNENDSTITYLGGAGVDTFTGSDLADTAPLATSKSPSIGHPKSPRQDGQIMSLLRCFEQIELRPL